MTAEERKALLDAIYAEIHEQLLLFHNVDSDRHRVGIIGRIGGLKWTRKLIEEMKDDSHDEG